MDRSSGILLHISSLPGSPYCGDLGGGAFRFVDFLVDSGQSWWQMLPVNPIDVCNSPYASVSSFAGEPIYIDLASLVEERLLKPDDVFPLPSGGPKSRAAFTAARDYRSKRWKMAFERFIADRGTRIFRDHYARFVEENDSWIWSHGIFSALSEKFGTDHWMTWPDESIRRADPIALREAAKELEQQIAFHIFLQLVFDVQWHALRDYCRERGVKLIGDIPIYVGANSSDIWANSHLFQIDKNATHFERIAGVPADSFNPDGQRWNSPLYRWEVHEEHGFKWWKERIRNNLRRFDVLRLDHFIGFYNYYSFPADETDVNSEHQYWTHGPAEKLLDSLFEEFPRTAFIAEDLGVMNPEIHALRDKYELPGMNVFQFSFDFRRDTDVTLDWQSNSIVCTGTHDTNTIIGWFDELRIDRLKPQPFWNFEFIYEKIKEYIPDVDPSQTQKLTMTDISQAIVSWVMNSPGNVAIFPMQDILGLGSDARMNFPGHVEDNWLWRLDEKYLEDGELATNLRVVTARYGRLPK